MNLLGLLLKRKNTLTDCQQVDRILNLRQSQCILADRGSRGRHFVCQSVCIFVSLVGIPIVITPMQSQNALQKT